MLFLHAAIALQSLAVAPQAAAQEAKANETARSATADLSKVTTRPAFEGLPGLYRPLDFGQLPDGRYYVVEQEGTLTFFEADAAGKVTKVEKMLELEVSLKHNEEGLLDFEPHPKFAENGRFYLHYSIPEDRRGRVSEWALNADGKVDRASERTILEIDQPWRNHNGGQILFGPDGTFYIGLGDGGSAGDPQENAQDLTTLLGSILRIDVDRRSEGLPYAIPDDNPFVRGEGLPTGTRREIWAFGLRNPWRFSFDPATGEMWCGDVGQDLWEEVHRIERGGNHGWRIKEGFADYAPDSRRGPGELVEPVVVYPHSQGVSITGGFVYRGSAVPPLVGHYVYADFVTNRVWAIDVAKERPEATEFTRVQAPSAFGIDNAGELYATSFGSTNKKRRDGRIVRFVLADQ